MKRSLSLLLAVFFISGCARQPSPELTYKNIVEASEKGNWDVVYDSLDSYTKGQMDISLKMLMGLTLAFGGNENMEGYDNLSGKDLFVKIAQTNIADSTDGLVAKSGYEVIRTNKNKEKAELIIKSPDGILSEVLMVMENNTWKLRVTDDYPSPADNTPQKSNLTMTEKIEREKERLLIEEMRQKEEAEKEKLQQAVHVVLIEKSFLNSDMMAGRYQDYITLKLAISNETNDDILGIKGTVIFKDLFGDIIKQVEFKYDEGISSHSKKTWNGTIDYNQFSSVDQKLRNTELQNLTVEWHPHVILFKDGNKLGNE